MKPAWAVAACGLLGGGLGLQKDPAITRLGPPQVEFPIGYGHLAGIRELPDRRVLVLERCAGKVWVIDFATGKGSQVGRTGSGPIEYRFAAGLLPLKGDSSVIYDYQNRRFLVVDHAAKPQRVFNALQLSMQSQGSSTLWPQFDPTGADSLGRLYAKEPALALGATGLFTPERVAIERWDPYHGARDTIALIRLSARPIPRGPLDTPVPFASKVSWAVARNGRVALVFPHDYHAEFIGPSGSHISGPPNKFARVSVSEGHKSEWLANLSECDERSRVATDPYGLPIRMVSPPNPREWPTELPPFLSDAAVFAPDGVLWIRRTTEVGAPVTYDLINDSGRVFHRVFLPNRVHLLGFGRGVAYLIRVDDDDLEYVQRHSYPILARF